MILPANANSCTFGYFMRGLLFRGRHRPGIRGSHAQALLGADFAAIAAGDTLESLDLPNFGLAVHLDGARRAFLAAGGAEDTQADIDIHMTARDGGKFGLYSRVQACSRFLEQIRQR